jgi:hypothetical protein
LIVEDRASEKNGYLLDAAECPVSMFFVTADKKMRYQQTWPAAGIALVVLGTPQVPQPKKPQNMWPSSRPG